MSLICTEALLWLTHQNLDYPESFGATFGIGLGALLPLPLPGYAPAREWDFTAQQLWWSWVLAHLRGNIADDAMQKDLHKTLYYFYTTTKMPAVTVTITKNASLAAVARYIGHFESRGTIYSYFDFGLKPAVVSCLTNAIAPPPIARESCLRAQTDRPVF